jgi:hypothetical protein
MYRNFPKITRFWLIARNSMASKFDFFELSICLAERSGDFKRYELSFFSRPKYAGTVRSMFRPRFWGWNVLFTLPCHLTTILLIRYLTLGFQVLNQNTTRHSVKFYVNSKKVSRAGTKKLPSQLHSLQLGGKDVFDLVECWWCVVRLKLDQERFRML